MVGEFSKRVKKTITFPSDCLSARFDVWAIKMKAIAINNPESEVCIDDGMYVIVLAAKKVTQRGGKCEAYGSCSIDKYGGICVIHGDVSVKQHDGDCLAHGSSTVIQQGGFCYLHDCAKNKQFGGICHMYDSSICDKFGGECYTHDPIKNSLNLSSLDELAESQGVTPMNDVAVLFGTWPDDEDDESWHQ